ncbi:MAG: MATE family efflux transporter [Lachnospiraceae bacterium]|nr:MATE family efflux transporter [Lachnospiraceae bacterium]
MNDYKKSIITNMVVLSIPTVLEEVMSTLLQYVDTAMVGHLGEEATAAVSTTTTIGWLIGGAIHAVGIAMLALMSRAVGERDEKRLRALSEQTVFLVILCAVFFGGISMLLAPYIPVWMGAAPDVRGPASEYFFIISVPMLFRASSLIFGSCIRATLDTKRPMIVNLIANVMNVILDYVLIYILDMGVRGAAYATAICHITAGTLMFMVYLKKPELSFDIKMIRPKKKLLHEISGIALPAMGTKLTSSLGYVVFAGMVSGMGTTIFAAHSIAVNAETIFYIPGYGLSSATSAMTGVAVGEKNRKKLSVIIKASVAMTIGTMIISGIILFMIANPLMAVFTDSARVVDLGASMLKLVAFSEPFFGLMVCMQGLFYGMGRTKNVFYVEAFSMWGIRILFTFLVVKVWQLGLTEVWYCMIADNITKALLLTGSMLYVLKKKKLWTD